MRLVERRHKEYRHHDDFGFPQKSWKWRSPGKVPELGLVTEHTQMAGRAVV